MARRDKVYIPSGVGGLIRYPEEERTKIKLKPEHVLYLILIVIILEFLLRIFV